MEDNGDVCKDEVTQVPPKKDPNMDDKGAPSDGAAAGARKRKKKRKKKKGKADMPMMPLFDEVSHGLGQEDLGKQHEFWHSQPVLKLGDEPSTNGPIEVRTLDEVNPDPEQLPDDDTWGTLHWCNVKLEDDKELDEVYNLLTGNYVEDNDTMFRFDYSKDFLMWALTPPHWRVDWHLGIRSSVGNELVGFISAIPALIRVYSQRVKMVEINFLCVHKDLRAKRLAPMLISEITRRVNLTDVWQAVYTAGVVLPKPVARCRYYHRSLNPQKLIAVRFSSLKQNMTMKRTKLWFKLDPEPKVAGIRPLEKRDIAQVTNLLSSYLSQFHFAPVFNQAEVKHWFMERDNVIYSYVVEQPDGRITDFASFYVLPSTILGHAKHRTLRAVYSFYNVSTVTPLEDLMGDALILAKSMDHDVFNALDLMHNDDFLKKLKFGPGDGLLQYYLYNWECPLTNPRGVGLVLM